MLAALEENGFRRNLHVEARRVSSSAVTNISALRRRCELSSVARTFSVRVAGSRKSETLTILAVKSCSRNTGVRIVTSLPGSRSGRSFSDASSIAHR